MKEYQRSTVRHEFHGTAPFLNHNTLPFLISDFYKFQGNCVFSHIGAELIFLSFIIIFSYLYCIYKVKLLKGARDIPNV